MNGAAETVGYRNGHKNPRNVYAEYADGSDRHIAVVFDEEFAGYVVAALNGTALVDTLERLPSVFAAQRASRKASYRIVQAETGISVSALRRLEMGGAIDLRTALAVLRWLGWAGSGDGEVAR